MKDCYASTAMGAVARVALRPAAHASSIPTRMTDDELEIPPIAPVAEGVPRPRWSVMIPAYNAERTIAETLQSVLSQTQAEEEMQIAVVDNVSTDATLAVV